MEPASRTEQGQFRKGVSGNPAGRARVVGYVQDLARKHTRAALKALVDALSDPKLKVAAAQALLDRGYGRAPQAIEHSGPDGGALTIQIIKYMDEEDDRAE